MNRQEVEKIRDFLVTLPDERFEYCFWFGYDGNPITPSRVNYDQFSSCGTTACVAGWICFLHKLDLQGNILNGPMDLAQEILGVSRRDAEVLFICGSDNATRQDAIRRLNHLLDYGSLVDYDISVESWVKPDLVW